MGGVARRRLNDRRRSAGGARGHAPSRRPGLDRVRAARERRAAGNHSQPPRLRGLAGEQHTSGRRPRRRHREAGGPMRKRMLAIGLIGPAATALTLLTAAAPTTQAAAPTTLRSFGVSGLTSSVAGTAQTV